MKFSSIVRMIGKILISAGFVCAIFVGSCDRSIDTNNLLSLMFFSIVAMCLGYVLYKYGKKINRRKRWVVYKIQDGIKYFISIDDGEITTDESKVYKFNYYKDVAVFIPYRK